MTKLRLGSRWGCASGHNPAEEKQRGQNRADYGRNMLLVQLSKRLTRGSWSEFYESNLRNIRQFYLAYFKRDALRHELSWTHYRILDCVENEEPK